VSYYGNALTIGKPPGRISAASAGVSATVSTTVNTIINASMRIEVRRAHDKCEMLYVWIDDFRDAI
jgi:hypothetical protein